jgi:hypothetical protein
MMLSALIMYFTFGAGFYVGLASHKPKAFIDADSASLIRGFLMGVVLWPVGLTFQVILALQDLDKKK